MWSTMILSCNTAVLMLLVLAADVVHGQQQQQQQKLRGKKQAEVIHHKLHPNVYELIYYYDQQYVYDQLSQQQQNYKSSILFDDTTNIASNSHKIFESIIYKEHKRYTSVGSATYDCVSMEQSTIVSSSLYIDAFCNVQITFHSSSRITNQTINTIQMQGILTVPTHDKINKKRNDEQNLVLPIYYIIGGTGIYYGATGQAILHHDQRYYKTIATFSILAPSQQHITTRTNSSTISTNPNATLPIIDPTRNHEDEATSSSRHLIAWTTN